MLQLTAVLHVRIMIKVVHNAGQGLDYTLEHMQSSTLRRRLYTMLHFGFSSAAYFKMNPYGTLARVLYTTQLHILDCIH